MFLALNSLGSSNMISFLHRFFTTHIKREKAPSWISKNKGNNISTSTQEAHTQPSNKKKSKQKNLKSKKEKEQHGTIQPSSHPTSPSNTPKIHPSYPISFCFRIHLVHLCGAFRLAGRLCKSLQGRLTAKIRSKAFLGELFQRWNPWSWI